jgi:hypothetical protein
MLAYPKGNNLYNDYEFLIMVFMVRRRSLVDHDFM